MGLELLDPDSGASSTSLGVSGFVPNLATALCFRFYHGIVRRVHLSFFVAISITNVYTIESPMRFPEACPLPIAMKTSDEILTLGSPEPDPGLSQVWQTVD